MSLIFNFIVRYKCQAEIISYIVNSLHRYTIAVHCRHLRYSFCRLAIKGGVALQFWTLHWSECIINIAMLAVLAPFCMLNTLVLVYR